LFVFDYCLTIGQEAHVVWKRRWTIATWLFIVTRYVALLCAGMIITTSTLSIAKFLCFAGEYWSVKDDRTVMSKHVPSVFSALRVFALLDGHFFVTAVVFLLTAVPAATNIVSLILSLVTRLAVIVADILVILTTWSKTLSAYRTAQRHKFKAPLVVMLFRDGESS
ncbi:hypothetical protein BC835DRAFT_1297283, partial [Cytidiella melzeri]